MATKKVNPRQQDDFMPKRRSDRRKSVEQSDDLEKQYQKRKVIDEPDEAPRSERQLKR